MSVPLDVIERTDTACAITTCNESDAADDTPVA
jgi:hypothetical protein